MSVTPTPWYNQKIWVLPLWAWLAIGAGTVVVGGTAFMATKKKR